MKVNARTIFRVFAGLLVAGAVVHVATAVPRVVALAAAAPPAAWAIVTGYAVSAATALLACGLAFLLLVKSPDRSDARTLTLFLAFLALFWGSLFRFVQATAERDSVSVSLSLGDEWTAQVSIVSFLLAIAAFVSFSGLFPRPLTAERLPPATRLRWLRRVRAALLRPRTLWTVAILAIFMIQWGGGLLSRLLGEPVGPDGSLRVVTFAPIAATILLMLLLPLPALGLGARNLLTSYRLATADERPRILWVVAGFMAASWMILGSLALLVLAALLDLALSVFGLAIPVAIFLAPFVAVLGAAVGILRSGAIDGGLVLQRSTVWGALGVLGVVAFAGLENAVSSWIEGRLGLPGFLGAMVAGGVVTAALIPVRRPLQRAVAAWARKRLGPEGTSEPRREPAGADAEENALAGQTTTESGA